MSQSPSDKTIEEETHAQQTHLLKSINSTIVIRQIPSQGIAFQLWPAAATLVSLLDRHRRREPTPLSSLFTSRPRLLELGSGTGLVGIAAAALLGASVTVTDLPDVLPNLRFNAAANAAVVELQGGAVEVAALSWGDERQMEAIVGGGDYDVIVGSDVVYHEHLYEPLIQTLRYFLLGSERKIVFLMAHLKRWKKESAFFKKAKRLFDVEVIYTDSPSDGSRLGVCVYTIVRRGL
ncbi:protein-lysine methyltransferase mettl21c [Phtheirospermum japonicum]|uniref:Protein-lysine methyltransferase mettl21c n=1 Tax=Phtheirospermum japonicum TaxID=374723 RepID=A0A830D3P2_9LAMI|nr:protein-lysine methyltransferase mettl21c [Phtheirospermum japonicum]